MKHTTPSIDYDRHIQFTMQQAVMRHFPDAQATYKFTHRDKDVFFTRKCFDLLKASVSRACLLSSETR